MIYEREFVNLKSLPNDGQALGIESHEPCARGVYAGCIGTKHQQSCGDWVGIHRTTPFAGDDAVYENEVPFSILRCRWAQGSYGRAVGNDFVEIETHAP